MGLHMVILGVWEHVVVTGGDTAFLAFEPMAGIFPAHRAQPVDVTDALGVVRQCERRPSPEPNECYVEHGLLWGDGAARLLQ